MTSKWVPKCMLIDTNPQRKDHAEVYLAEDMRAMVKAEIELLEGLDFAFDVLEPGSRFVASEARQRIQRRIGELKAMCRP